MSLFEKIKSRKINLTEQSFTDRQRSDMKKLLNKNFGNKEISKKTADTQKQLAKDNKKMFDVTGKSAVRDAKKYASGEYPKIGGGTRIGSKSKGSGAETGAKVNLNPTSGSKSKGNKPVTVSTTKTVKQSDISKQAKKFTKKINKRNINRPEGVIGDTYVSTDKKGKIRSAKRVNPTLKKSVSQVKADIEFKKGLQKAGASGDVSDTAPKSVRDYVTKKRETRASKLGLKDPFKIDTSKAAKDVAKDFGTEPVKGGIKFGKPGTGVKDTIKNFQPRDVSAKTYAAKVDAGLKKAQKSFKKLSSDLQDYRDRDTPGGPRKTRVTRTRVSYRTTPGGRESVGMASKFVNKYKKGSPMNPEISGIDFDKPKTNLKSVSDVSGGSGGGKKPPKITYGAGPTPQGPEPRRIIKQFSPGSTGKVNVSLLAKQNKGFYKSARKITKVLPATKGITKTLAKLGPKGRAAAAITSLALASPTVRKGVGGLIKRGLTGAGLGGLVGAGAQLSKKKPVGDAVLGPKRTKTVTTSLEPPKPKETTYSKTMKSVKPYDFTKIKQDIANKKQKEKADRLAKIPFTSASEKQRLRRGIA